MRIWSKKLITSGVLPTKQLKAMRYELGDMIKQWPNIKHPLVKFANNYDSNYLLDYFEKVIKECEIRNISMDINYNEKIIQTAISKSIGIVSSDYTFLEDNSDYLKICFWNLYEKAIREVITDEEWKKIEDYLESEVN